MTGSKQPDDVTRCDRVALRHRWFDRFERHLLVISRADDDYPAAGDGPDERDDPGDRRANERANTGDDVDSAMPGAPIA